MYESFIKEWLLAGQSRVYSMIVGTYRQKLDDLKPTLFRKWLAREIDIPEDKINLSSLNSALVRQRKKESKGENKSSPIAKQDKNPDSTTFIFFSPDNAAQKRRTTEL
ncbi:MAG: hypothetical protein ABI813_02115 [Bacteroidota bacterium]